MSSRTTRLGIAAALAAACLGSAAGPALASRAIGTVSGNAETTTIAGQKTLQMVAVGVVCTWSLSVTFPASTSKVTGAPLFTINSGTISACGTSGITGTILGPISFGYSAFTGALPAITLVSGNNTTAFSFLASGGILAAGCRFTAAAGAVTASVQTPSSAISSLTMTGTFSTIVALPGGNCPPNGTQVVVRAGTLTASPTIPIRLIN